MMIKTIIVPICSDNLDNGRILPIIEPEDCVQTKNCDHSNDFTLI